MGDVVFSRKTIICNIIKHAVYTKHIQQVKNISLTNKLGAEPQNCPPPLGFHRDICPQTPGQGTQISGTPTKTLCTVMFFQILLEMYVLINLPELIAFLLFLTQT